MRLFRGLGLGTTVVGVDFCFLLCYSGTLAVAGRLAFVKRTRDCGGGATEALLLALGNLWPRTLRILGRVPGWTAVQTDGGMRVPKAFKAQSCI